MAAAKGLIFAAARALSLMDFLEMLGPFMSTMPSSSLMEG